MYRTLFALLFAPTFAQAATVSIVSDPTTYTPAPTHCAWYMDATARQQLPVAVDGDGLPYCTLDVTMIAAGSHTVTAAWVNDDGLWPVEEGPKSSPFDFTRSAASGAGPTGLRLRR